MCQTLILAIDRELRALRSSGLGVYIGLIVVLLGMIAWSGSVLVTEVAQPVARLLQIGDPDVASFANGRPVQTAHRVLEGDAWAESLKTRWDTHGAKPSNLGVGPISRPAASEPIERNGDRGRLSASVKTHRTMCVRLCDGYFYPMSFATSRSHFERDEAMCARSCGSPTRLYVYDNPGGELEEMVNLAGQPYAKLPTAFRFRSEIDQSCKCRPDPWEPEAMARHKQFAEAAMRPTSATRQPPAREKRAEADVPILNVQSVPMPQVSSKVAKVWPQVAVLNASASLTDAPAASSLTAGPARSNRSDDTPAPARDVAVAAEKVLAPALQRNTKPEKQRTALARPTTSASASIARPSRSDARLVASASPRRESSGNDWRSLAFNHH